MNVGSSIAYNRFVLISKTDTEIILEHEKKHNYLIQSYLGTITNSSGAILWVNKTEPMPN